MPLVRNLIKIFEAKVMIKIRVYDDEKKGVERNDISGDSPPLRTNNDGHTLEKEVENYNCVTSDMTCAQQTPKGNIEF